ncbi:MAG: antirestriction protein [Enterobacter asburiae]|nr:antirestriction protein [Serratia liquefaciens]AMG98878.1 antirestriction protein [Serratia liquefaciens]MDU3925646.1 antirestriction protein [Enterobacter asburiae]
MKNNTANSTPSTSPINDLPTLTATLVPDADRQSFWLQHFGNIPQWLRIESPIFSWLDLLCKDYHGDYWEFYTLSNGGAFIIPSTEREYALFNALNGNSATVGHEAAGIIACLITYSHHACRTECDAMTEHYYRLRDYALNHPECNAIMRIID